MRDPSKFPSEGQQGVKDRRDGTLHTPGVPSLGFWAPLGSHVGVVLGYEATPLHRSIQRWLGVVVKRVEHWASTIWESRRVETRDSSPVESGTAHSSLAHQRACQSQATAMPTRCTPGPRRSDDFRVRSPSRAVKVTESPAPVWMPLRPSLFARVGRARRSGSALPHGPRTFA